MNQSRVIGLELKYQAWKRKWRARGLALLVISSICTLIILLRGSIWETPPDTYRIDFAGRIFDTELMTNLMMLGIIIGYLTFGLGIIMLFGIVIIRSEMVESLLKRLMTLTLLVMIGIVTSGIYYFLVIHYLEKVDYLVDYL